MLRLAQQLLCRYDLWEWKGSSLQRVAKKVAREDVIVLCSYFNREIWLQHSGIALQAACLTSAGDRGNRPA